MATISERLRELDEFAPVSIQGPRDQETSLFLPDRIVKAFKAEAEQRRKIEKVEGVRANGRKIMSANQRPTFGQGKFFSDIGAVYDTSSQGLKKPYGSLSFRSLRALGMVWIDRLIINARKAQMRRFAQVCDAPGKQLGFRCVHKKYQNVDVDTDTPDIRRRCKEMDDRLKNVTKPVHKSFADFIENMVEEELVIDRRVIIKTKTKGGSIGSYHMIDGETIRPRLEVLAEWMIANQITDIGVAERRIQYGLLVDPPRTMTGQRRAVPDFLNAAYVQVLDERVVDAWREEDIYVAIAHPTIRMNQWGYGRSPLEDSWGWSLLFMQAMGYNQNLFDVNYPEAILSISGEVDEEGLGAFKRNVFEWDRSEASTRLPIIAGGSIAEEFKAELIRLRDSPKDMLMTELIRFVANMKCAAYGMHPSEINVTPDGQGGAVVNVDQSQGDEIADATERGFHSLAYGQADVLTDALIVPDHDDLMYIIEGLDREGEQGQAAKIESYSAHSTFNELRAMRDQKPLPKGIPVDPGDFLVNPEYVQIVQMMQQTAQAQQQQDMGSYGQGDFGQPDDDSQQPFGGQPGQGGPPGAPGGPPGAPQVPGGPPGGGSPPGAPGARPGVPLGAPGGRGGGLPNVAGAPRKPNPLMRSEMVELAHFHGDGQIDWAALLDDEEGAE